VVLPYIDSAELAAARREELRVTRERATSLGLSAVQAIQEGAYSAQDGQRVDWSVAVRSARETKVSVPPDAALPDRATPGFDRTQVVVSNETTLGAARRLAALGHRPLALNFANGVQPGGGFLLGARAQEEVLCRSSALFATLQDDPMYEAHRRRGDNESSAWAILSPEVPVFRSDDGTTLSEPWPLSFISCAAPYAPAVGQPRSGELLAARILRILDIGRAYGFETLVLGAWGCGAFGNDASRAARDFRRALQDPFAGCFREIVFAIADWSPERHNLGPFRDAFRTIA
jgi:uncharacterized protein (TIGR02452 family)